MKHSNTGTSRNSDSIPSSHEKKISLRTGIQETFLTCTFFMQNDLITYASACAFNFLFSLLPVIIMTATVLIRILHASPDILQNIFNYEISLSAAIDLPGVIYSFLETKGSLFFNIIIGVSLFWMARRLFNSVMLGIRCIFHTEVKSRPLITQLIVLAGEVLLVVILALLIFLFATAKSVLSSSVLVQVIPQLLQTISARLLQFVPAGLMFSFVTIIYRAASGTKPSGITCILASAACTSVFFAFKAVFSLFVDMAKYNLIYGVLSNGIVLLLEVLTFFILVMFFAQFVFVHQFFDQLLLAELYLLPGKNDCSPVSVIRRIMFIKPDYFIRRTPALIVLQPGSIIYREGDDSTDVYYISEGSVQLSSQSRNNITHYGRGAFFGERACILSQPRDATATAETILKIIKVSGETFTAMLNKNPAAGKKALSRISAYFARSKQF